MKKLFYFVIALLVSMASHQKLSAQSIDLAPIASGLNAPVDIKSAGDERLFIVEQVGLIKIIDLTTNSISPNAFLDISSLISTGGERGLLSMAFPADYNISGKFYIYYTDTTGSSVISQYSVSNQDPNQADPNGSVILTYTQPFANHNAGCMQFGPDGFLYIASGDGGSGGDPGNRAQDNNTLLGKMLRLDVTGSSNGNPYSIPASNPFASSAGADEIFSTGLRNPWKFSFDSNNIWIADVGQNATEEINRQSVSNNIANYGWRCYEGSNNFNVQASCPPVADLVFPLAEYNHTGSGLNKCSITGGYVYRGNDFPNLQGTYFFADFCSNEIGMLDASQSNPVIRYTSPYTGAGFSSFGVDQNNELYVAHRNTGTISRIVDTTASFETPSFLALKLYPNPADSSITIQTDDNSVKTYKIFDARGKVVSKGTLSATKTIDISIVKSGIYFVNCKGMSTQYSKRFIVR
ncbi:hypothetical protein BST97_06890 [Nonlabens spongiae]|uniref:Cadherin n=1 Tax=Nonlabens spongiae TaxID=331648 RepID=A0A1W6MJF3_9FLAO|nr:PQQ-dependent sugar dehydrogenase [Nonlabens spongiae]ARN77744.1 hypothetical protein BST97_06890 [Nonlabens spongiae]